MQTVPLCEFSSSMKTGLRSIFYSALLLLLTLSVRAQGPPDQADEKFPVLTFEETEWQWGQIEEGDTVKHVFSFINTGNAPLIIERAKGSCSCTKGYFSEEAIKPGEKGWVRIEFDTKDKDWGHTDRNLLVFYNGESPKPMEVKVIGEIIEPKVEAPKPNGKDGELNLGGDEEEKDENGNTLFKWR